MLRKALREGGRGGSSVSTETDEQRIRRGGGVVEFFGLLSRLNPGGTPLRRKLLSSWRPELGGERMRGTLEEVENSVGGSWVREQSGREARREDDPPGGVERGGSLEYPAKMQCGPASQ